MKRIWNPFQYWASWIWSQSPLNHQFNKCTMSKSHQLMHAVFRSLHFFPGTEVVLVDGRPIITFYFIIRLKMSTCAISFIIITFPILRVKKNQIYGKMDSSKDISDISIDIFIWSYCWYFYTDNWNSRVPKQKKTFSKWQITNKMKMKISK